MNLKNKSWKTSSAGICAIVIALASAGRDLSAEPAVAVDWGAVIAAIIAGVGLLAARDNDKSSESVAAK